MADFTYTIDHDGIATISWDVPDRNMNVMSAAGFSELAESIEQALSDENVVGIVIDSSKKDFAGGMDLNALAEMKRQASENPAQAIFDFSMRVHKLLRKIELAGKEPGKPEGGKPVAAALPGTAVGIGYELPLACHRIFCADNPKARIGLPEIKVGLFPAAGGTTRLVRKLGVMEAGQFLLKGKTLSPGKAKAAGLIDEVVPLDSLLQSAKEWILSAQGADISKPWDRKGYRMPGGRPYDREGFTVFMGAAAMVNAETQGVYPAAKALLSTIYEGSLVPFDTALKIEARWLTNLLMQPSPSAMIQTLFVNKRALEKGARRPSGIPKIPVRKLGVLGAGMMGSGIGLVSAKAGIEVVLLERDQESANAGAERISRVLEREVSRGRLASSDKEGIGSLITPAADYEYLCGCDLVIEAVFEDPAVKASVLAMCADAVGEDCVIASNTSTLPISGLAESVSGPERFLGIHFFSPVHRMMLVEIIRGVKTGDAAVAKAVDLVASIRKTPIIVNDARFFYANRCIIPYLNEGVRMVREGIKPALIDNAARLLGMPVGPLQLVDETSIELAAGIAQATKAALGDQYRDQDVDEVIFNLCARGRAGRKSNAGFYDYDERGRRKGFWPGLVDEYPLLTNQPDVEEVRRRLLLIQALEAVRALEENVLLDVREGDVGAVLGWGFAPWSGGPFGWIDGTGATKTVQMCNKLSERHGERFAAPELLLDHAKSGKGFYRTAQ